jgi:hypothetical protein
MVMVVAWSAEIAVLRLGLASIVGAEVEVVIVAMVVVVTAEGFARGTMMEWPFAIVIVYKRRLPFGTKSLRLLLARVCRRRLAAQEEQKATCRHHTARSHRIPPVEGEEGMNPV